MRGFAKFGTIIVMLMCFAIPILTTLSFCLYWDGFITAMLTILTAGEILLACICACWYVDDHYDD